MGLSLICNYCILAVSPPDSLFLSISLPRIRADRITHQYHRHHQSLHYYQIYSDEE